MMPSATLEQMSVKVPALALTQSVASEVTALTLVR